MKTEGLIILMLWLALTSAKFRRPFSAHAALISKDNEAAEVVDALSMVFGGLDQPHHADMKSRLLSEQNQTPGNDLPSMNALTKCCNVAHCSDECMAYNYDCHPNFLQRAKGIKTFKDKKGRIHHTTSRKRPPISRKIHSSGGITYCTVSVTDNNKSSSNVKYEVSVKYNTQNCNFVEVENGTDTSSVCVVYNGYDGHDSNTNTNDIGEYYSNYYGEYGDNGSSGVYDGGLVCVTEEGEVMNCPDGVDTTDSTEGEWSVVVDGEDEGSGGGSVMTEYIETNSIVNRDATALAVGVSVAAVGIVGVASVYKFRSNAANKHPLTGSIKRRGVMLRTMSGLSTASDEQSGMSYHSHTPV